jgi:hypothetical protein
MVQSSPDGHVAPGAAQDVPGVPPLPVLPVLPVPPLPASPVVVEEHAAPA